MKRRRTWEQRAKQVADWLAAPLALHLLLLPFSAALSEAGCPFVITASSSSLWQLSKTPLSPALRSGQSGRIRYIYIFFLLLFP